MTTSLTTGSYDENIKKLLTILQKLVNSGNTVVVEYNLDVIKTSDWIIDLRPEGGAAGGQIVPEGRPEQGGESSGVSHWTIPSRHSHADC